MAHPVKYILSRVKRLMIPFLLWSIFYSGINIVRDIKDHQIIDWQNLIFKFIIGKASTQLYYIVVLMQLVLLTPVLIQLIRKSERKSIALYCITPIWLVGVYIYNIVNQERPMFYETFFPAWFCFYYLGIRIKTAQTCVNKIEKVQKYFGKPIVVLVLLAFSIVESFILLYLGCCDSFIISQIKFGNFIYTFAIIFLIRQIRGKTQSDTKGFGILSEWEIIPMASIISTIFSSCSCENYFRFLAFLRFGFSIIF